MIKLSEQGIEELQQEYDTRHILHAIEALDELRSILADDGQRRPAGRDKLLKIYQLAHKRLDERYTLTDDEVDELKALIEDVDMQVFRMLAQLEKIEMALGPLEKMFASEAGWDDDAG